jgi:hypothetical protein
MTDYTGSLGSQYTLRLRVIQSNQSIENNTSTLSWSLEAIKNSGSGYWSYSSTTAARNVGSSGSKTISSYDFRGVSSITLDSGTEVVTHDADGTKSITVTSSWNPNNGSALSSGSTSGTFTMTTIARASTPTLSAASFDTGTAVTINMNRASTNFTHTVTFDFGALTDQSIATGVATSTTWTPAASLLNQIPTAVSGAGVVRVVTYSGGTLVGTKTVGFTLTVPASVVPTISSLTVAEATTSPDVATIVGAYVQGVSSLALTIVGAAGAYGSSVSSYRLAVGVQVINAVSGTTTPITVSGTVPIAAEVTDSRGRQSSFAVTNITVLPYVAPNASPVEASRALADGTVDQSEGTYIRIDMSAVVQSLINGTQKNLISYRVSSSPYNANTWTVRVSETSAGASTLTFDSFGGSNPYILLDAGHPITSPLTNRLTCWLRSSTSSTPPTLPR